MALRAVWDEGCAGADRLDKLDFECKRKLMPLGNNEPDKWKRQHNITVMPLTRPCAARGPSIRSPVYTGDIRKMSLPRQKAWRETALTSGIDRSGFECNRRLTLRGNNELDKRKR